MYGAPDLPISNRAMQMMHAMRDEYMAWTIQESRYEGDKTVMVHDSKRVLSGKITPTSIHYRFMLDSREEAEDWVTARSVQVALDMTQGFNA